MSTRFVVAAVVGVVVGYYSGDAQLGAQAFALTYGVTASLDPAVKVVQPRLDDLKAPSAAYGAPIAYLEGTQRVPGNIVWSTDKLPVDTTTSNDNKGGPSTDTTTTIYVMDMLIVLTDCEAMGVRRCWSNGKLIWTSAADATGDSLAASAQTDAWTEMRFYRGAADQLPDPDYEAAVGVGNAPAYRGRSSVFIKGLNLGSGGYIPVLTWEVVRQGTIGGTSALIGEYGDGYSDIYVKMGPMRATEEGLVTKFRNDTASDLSYVTATLTYDGQAQAQNVGHEALLDAPWVYQGDIDTNSLLIPRPTPAGDTARTFEVQGEDFQIPLVRCGEEIGATDPCYCIRNNVLWVASESNGKIGRTTTGAMDPIGLAPVLTGGIRGLATDGSILLALTTEGDIYEFDAVTMDIVGPIALPDGESPAESSVIVCNEQGHFLFATGGHPDGRLYSRAGSSWALLVDGMGEASPQNQTQFTRYAARGDVLYTARPPLDQSTHQRTQVFIGVPTLVPADIPLSDIVLRQCMRGGLRADQVDVTDLAEVMVHGMPVTQVVSPRSVIETLMAAYLFEAVESGSKVRFVLRGGTTAFTVGYDELGASSGDAVSDALPETLGNDIEMPAIVFVKYSNFDDDYQDGLEQAERGVTRSQVVANVEITLALTPTEAKKVATINAADIAASINRVGPFATSRARTALEPTDCGLLTRRDGSQTRVRLTKRTDAGGVLTFEAIQDDASVVLSDAVTSGGYTNSFKVSRPTSTEWLPLDIPILRDADDDSGFYSAGLWKTGRGYTLFRAPDGVSYESLFTTPTRSVIGTATTTLDDWDGGDVFDEMSSLTVKLHPSSDALSSTTRDAMVNSNANAALVGSEVIQFRDAAMLSADTFALTGFLRGRRGTEWACNGHGSSEPFVLLTLEGLRRTPVDTAKIGVSMTYKAVTASMSLAKALAIDFADTAVGKKPFSPVDARGSRSKSGDATLTWRRRTRLDTKEQGGVYVPLGEAVEGYSIDVFTDDSFTTVKRTLSSATHQVLYSADQQIVDFGLTQSTFYVDIYQLSAVVGHGYPLRAAIGVGVGATFVVNPAGKKPAVLVGSDDNWLLWAHGNSTSAVGLFSYANGDDEALLQLVIPESSSAPYLETATVSAHDGAGTFVAYFRNQGNSSTYRKMVRGTLPTMEAVAPTFMPTAPPAALWWTGSEFRAFLTDTHVWSSADGKTWVDQGAVTGGPTSPALDASLFNTGYVVKVGSKLTMKFGGDFYTSANTDGTTWTAALGAIATPPLSTYDAQLFYYAIASNGSRGVVLAQGRKTGDYKTYVLIYTSTDGATWSLATTVEAYPGSPEVQFNAGLFVEGSDFYCNAFPPIPGSNSDQVLEVYDFSGTKLWFTKVAETGKSDGTTAIFRPTGGGTLNGDELYSTDDLVNFTKIELES